MPKTFKNLYNQEFLENFAKDLKQVLGNFNTQKFVALVFDKDWANKEYKERSNHIAIVLNEFLPNSYKDAVEQIIELLDYKKNFLPDIFKIDDKNYGLKHLDYGPILDRYIEIFGLDDLETSIIAMEKVTQFTTCEYSVRLFIEKFPAQMMQQMLAWSKHESWAVRRLASEGCRPRLPWGIALDKLKKNPSPILPILENLKNDPARYVRLSVANNLNDISKDNPEVVLEIAKSWKGLSAEVDWVIKHGCRTLLKQGNKEALELFGFDTDLQEIEVDNFRLSSSNINIGESLKFTFDLHNRSTEDKMIRLEYAIYYMKANGKLSKKVFKISEIIYIQNSFAQIERAHSFKPVTTRKLYPGLHKVALIVNGRELEQIGFILHNH